MQKRNIALGVIILLFAILSYLVIRNLASIVGPTIQPTQTSLYAGRLDPTKINKLRAPQPNGKISREQAIGLGEIYCGSSSPPKESPTNIKAELVTETVAQQKLGDENPGFSSKEEWLVTMDGAWEFTGGPEPRANETRVPVQFKHCRTILDAKNGEFIRLQQFPSTSRPETTTPTPK